MLHTFHKKSVPVLITLAAVFAFFRVAMMMRTPIYALGNAVHDDFYLLTLADHLANGRWLGPYTATTLSKGISFPVFFALCSYLCIPYYLGLGLFYLASVLVFLQAVRSKIKSPFLLFGGFLFLLYSPALLSTFTQQRLYNLALIPGSVLLVLGSFIGMLFRADSSFAVFLRWNLLSSVSLVFFWHLRNDSLWLLPFAFCISAICAFCIWRNASLHRTLLRLLLCLLPLAALFCSHHLISAVNASHYGIYAVNDRSGTNEAKVMSCLLSIEAPSVREDVWVSYDTIKKAMSCSKTFASIKPQMEDMYRSPLADRGEIHGDIFVWAIREAAQAAGYYNNNAPETDAFYGKICRELTEAFEKGELKKDHKLHLSSLSKGITPEDVPALLRRMKASFVPLVNAAPTYVGIRTSVGTPEQIRLFETMAGANAIYPDQNGKSDREVLDAQRVVGRSNKILSVYHLTGWGIFFLSVACWILLTLRLLASLRKKIYDLLPFWLTVTGLFLTFVLLLFAVCWFTSFLGDQILEYYIYLTAGITLIEVSEFLLLGEMATALAEKWRQKKRKAQS